MGKHVPEADRIKRDKERAKNYRLVNKEIIAKRKQLYYEANKQEILKKRQEYQSANKLKIAQRKHVHYEINKERILESGRVYHAENKETINQKVKAYYEANKHIWKDYVSLNREHIAEEMRKYAIKNRRTIRDQAYKRKYALAIEQVEELVLSQRSKCKCCSSEFQDDRYVVDHDHVSGEIRGILCSMCNLIIGRLGDNYDSVLMNATMYANYLLPFRKEVK